MITKDTLINGLIAGGVEKFSQFCMEFILQEMAKLERDQSETYIAGFKNMAKDFLSHDELGRGAFKLAMAKIIDGLGLVSSNISDNTWVKKVREECEVSAMSDVIQFTGNNIFELAQPLMKTFLGLGMKEQAHALKNFVQEKAQEAEEFDLSKLNIKAV